jgi:hypothetical protein
MPMLTRSQHKLNADSSLSILHLANTLSISQVRYTHFKYMLKKMLEESDENKYLGMKNKLKKVNKFISIFKFVNDKIVNIFSEMKKEAKNRNGFNEANKFLLVIYNKTIELENGLNKYNSIIGYEFAIDKLKMQLYKCRQIIKPLIDNIINTPTFVYSKLVVDTYNYVNVSPPNVTRIAHHNN